KSRKADLIICGYDIFDDYTGQIKKKVFGRPDESQIELVLRGNLVVFPLRVAFTHCLVSRVGIWAADMKTGEDREYIERALCLANNPIGIRNILGALRRGASIHLSHDFSQAYRVRCEETLLRNVCRRRDISIDAINSLISRITRIGCKLNTLGFTELGLRCADSVSHCGIPLSGSERVKILLCRLGKPGGILYTAFIWLKQSSRSG
ncbi:MAG: hypothetical protein PF482_01365, partial [Desulfobacteraceae bacterium]|nr:hypothetical protein [Desulfobacteraceae bacterium]